MFDGKRREVGIGNQIPFRLYGAQQAREDLPVAIARRKEHAVWTRPDLGDELERRIERAGILEHLGVADDAKEATEYQVRHPERSVAVDYLIEPSAANVVAR